ncbi:type II toxin-antitoxin system RelE/ParE family toxin [bacterium]|nr:type II toxin-antitoxin system RelE/ParE family toxin [bacterium]
MNNLKLVIENTAENDMLSIAEYIAKDNKTAAANLLKIFYGTFNNLTIYPELGLLRPDFTYKDVRFYTVKKHYLIIYTVKDSEIHILRVLSSYQDICGIL